MTAHLPPRGASDDRERLVSQLVTTDDQIRQLRGQHGEIVAASRDSNADDEHDPEGSTIAFERQQVAALITALQATRHDIDRALVALDQGTYGVCTGCGRPIGAQRLQARPSASTCIDCASRRR